ncbi:MAG: redoxin domain-containing (seleno)protein, partial [Tepidiformaceae bacterium]
MNARTTDLTGTSVDGDAIWLPVETLEATTGWVLKPEGACLAERCVPIPRGREAEFVHEGHFNIAALAEYLDQPILRDSAHEVVAIGESAE